MKALTVRQPWASLIALGIKTVETRSWRTNYRGPLAIHAGAKPLSAWTLRGGFAWGKVGGIGNWRNVLQDCRGEEKRSHVAPLGAVVATCTLVDVVPIVEDVDDVPDSITCVEHSGDSLYLWSSGEDDDEPERSVRDQLPFGDFTSGRWAWLLDDIKRCDPIPAKGRQGLWTWEAA